MISSTTPTPCRAISTTRACAATASTGFPTNMSAPDCARSTPKPPPAALSSPIPATAPRCVRSTAGRSVASTSGSSTLDGLPTGTSARQARPRRPALSPDRERLRRRASLSDLLYKKSGLAGLSGVSNDWREVEAADDAAQRATPSPISCIALSTTSAASPPRCAASTLWSSPAASARTLPRACAPPSPSAWIGSALPSTRPPTAKLGHADFGAGFARAGLRHRHRRGAADHRTHATDSQIRQAP